MQMRKVGKEKYRDRNKEERKKGGGGEPS